MQKLIQMNDNELSSKYSFKHNDIRWCLKLFTLDNQSTASPDNIFDKAQGEGDNGQSKSGGIKAIKYNYTKENRKEVRMWFNDDFSKLCWKNDEKFFKSNCKVSQIRGIIFGAFSATFEKHKAYVHNFDKFQQFTLQDLNPNIRRRSDVNRRSTKRKSLRFDAA